MVPTWAETIFMVLLPRANSYKRLISYAEHMLSETGATSPRVKNMRGRDDQRERLLQQGRAGLHRAAPTDHLRRARPRVTSVPVRTGGRDGDEHHPSARGDQAAGERGLGRDGRPPGRPRGAHGRVRGA